MIYLYISALLISAAVFIGAIAACLYVGYKFLMAIHVDLRVIREYAQNPFIQTNAPFGTSFSAASAARNPQTDGDFVFNTDEELAIAEEVRRAKAETGAMMSDEDEKELATQIRQGGVTYKG